MTPSQSLGSASNFDTSNFDTAAVAGALTGAGAATTCHHCGGSGMLRLGDQRYRTCLECLGQGQLLRPSLGTLFVPRISVAAAASGAK
ncbi:MAG: hypothetical protein WAM11_06205 [Cyanobium sp.]